MEIWHTHGRKLKLTLGLYDENSHARSTTFFSELAPTVSLKPGVTGKLVKLD